VLRALDRSIEPALVVLLSVVLVACLTYSALVRYFISDPFFTSLSHQAEELAVFAFIWLLYFGSVLATRDGAHFRVSAHFALLPQSWQRWALLPGDIAWQAFNLFVVWQGLQLVSATMQRPEPSLSLQVPMQYVYAVIPLAFALTFIRLLQRYLRGEAHAAGSHETSQL